MVFVHDHLISTHRQKETRSAFWHDSFGRVAPKPFGFCLLLFGHMAFESFLFRRSSSRFFPSKGSGVGGSSLSLNRSSMKKLHLDSHKEAHLRQLTMCSSQRFSFSVKTMMVFVHDHLISTHIGKKKLGAPFGMTHLAESLLSHLAFVFCFLAIWPLKAFFSGVPPAGSSTDPGSDRAVVRS